MYPLVSLVFLKESNVLSGLQQFSLSSTIQKLGHMELQLYPSEVSKSAITIQGYKG